MKTFWKFIVAFFTVLPAFGTSFVFPTYSKPVFVDNTVVVLSPDQMTLIGVSKAGKKLWQRRLPAEGSLITTGSGQTLLTQGASASSLNPKDGTLTPQFTTNPRVDQLHYHPETNLFWGPLEKEESTLALFDGSTYACLTKQKNTESLAYADADLIVLAKGHRKSTKGGGFSFSRGWIEALNRKTMRKLWSADYQKEPWPYHDVVRCGAYMISEDGSDLLAIDINSGEVRRSPAVKHQDALGPNGLRNDNGSLIYLTSRLNRDDFKQNDQILYKLSVPDFKVLERRVVKVIEASTSEKVGSLLITDSLYRTACFRRDGTKLWERFQLNRTRAIDGMIYFSDYNEGVARMGVLEIATGKQRILLSERLETGKP